MDKNSQPKIYGVLGYPAKHSLSPLMHNAAFQALKINAEYRIFEKNPEELEGFLHSLFRENILGLNVTVPYKERIIPFLEKLSLEAELIGAVNTLRASANKLEGFNTDGEGFLKHLTVDLGFDPGGKTIALLGAGGAAKALSVYLSKTKPKSIAIYDLDKNRLAALIKHLKESFHKIEFKSAESIEGLNIGGSDLLVNATPVGMKESDPSPVDEKFIRAGLLVYDLIYNPKETKLLKAARDKGASVSNGLGMLLYQGVASFEIWTGKKAPVEIMRQALNKGVAKT
ncbi:MAG: shikimate dehydrogenase [Candidatus Omnitrophota bacterium]|jgi:shikimate dehydrogenase